MLTISALLIPFMVFLIWSIILFAMQDKGISQKYLTVLLAIATVYFYIDAFYLAPEGTHSDYVALVFMDIVSQFITLALPVSALLYIKSLQGTKMKTGVAVAMYAPSVFLGTTAIVIYNLMGVSNAADYLNVLGASGGHPMGYDAPIYKMHETICQKAYNIVLLTEVLITLTIIIMNLTNHPHKRVNFKKFLDGKEKVSPFAAECIGLIAILIICAIRIGLGRTYLVQTPGISALLSIFLGCIGLVSAYIGVWFPDREFDFWDLQHPVTLRASETAPEVAQEAVAKIKKEQSAPQTQQKSRTAPAQQHSDSKAPTLLEQFVSYMVTKKPYLDPDINISDVATALRSNRTYISVLINENFEMTFRDYINKLRLDHAKQIMLKNPDEILEVIAERSGFGSDSQFAKKFKEIEGVSPKLWLSEQLKKQDL